MLVLEDGNVRVHGSVGKSDWERCRPQAMQRVLDGVWACVWAAAVWRAVGTGTAG